MEGRSEIRAILSSEEGCLQFCHDRGVLSPGAHWDHGQWPCRLMAAASRTLSEASYWRVPWESSGRAQ